MVQFIISLTGLIGVAVFALPLSFNIGNITGIIVSLLLFFYGIFYSWINRFTNKIWHEKRGRFALTLVTSAILLIIGLASVSTYFMISAVNKKPSDSSVLIILGCQVVGDVPSLALRERLEAAKEYLEENPECICIVSGGQGPGEHISEAECMFNWLRDNGIDPSRILLEARSTSTIENIKFSKELIDKYELGDSISIATNDFHLYRAGTIAESFGLSYGSVPAKTSWWLLPTFYVREMYGILYQWAFA